MHINRRSFTRRVAVGLAAGSGIVSSGAIAQSHGGARSAPGLHNGKIFTSTNNAAGNEIVVVGADAGGALALLVSYQTGGLGSGAGLGSQGAVTLSDDGRYLFVVNAGSNTVSTFSVGSGALSLVSTHDSGGLHPISVAESAGLVYVLNDGGAGNVAGFRNLGGTLAAIAGSVRPLSAAGGTGPAQVNIGTNGDVLVVTEKNTNLLVSYALDAEGRAGAPLVTASVGGVPFGFVFDRRNRMLVSEAAISSLSTYRFNGAAPTTPVRTSGPVANQQAAACWAIATRNSRFVYTGNAGTNTISHYALDPTSGAATLVSGAAGSTKGGGAGDLATPPHGRTLSILAPRTRGVFSFAVASDGSLTPDGSLIGLPADVVGLAAN